MSSSSRDRSWGWLMAITPAAAFFLLYACGRFESEPESADSGVDGSNGADVVEELFLPRDAAGQADALADAAPAGDAHADADAADGACVYVGPGGGSSTSGGACMSEEKYTCNGKPASLTCNCPGSCTCGTKTLPCPAAACVISPAMRQQCGFPAIP